MVLLICKGREIQGIIMLVLLVFVSAFFLGQLYYPQSTTSLTNKSQPAAAAAAAVVAYDQLLDESLLPDFGIYSLTSDFAYLHHCNLSLINATLFSYFQQVLTSQLRRNVREQFLHLNKSYDLQEEMSLQGLELFARASKSCNWTYYHPTVPSSASVDMVQVYEMIANIPLASSSNDDEARFVFCISAFKDFPQLAKLVEAIYLPQHLIIIHLERRTPPDYVVLVDQLTKQYTNVVVLQFGSVIYPTDSISHIMLSIMHWVTLDLKFQYDYIFTMGASAYPLFAASEMAQYLKLDKKRVRLGPIVNGHGRCRRKGATVGLSYSRGLEPKLHRRYVIEYKSVKQHLYPLLVSNWPTDDSTSNIPPVEAFYPPHLEQCTLKTNSGNTAAFDHDTVVALLESSVAMEFFSRFRLSGNCCNEESSWGGALGLSGKEEKELYSPGAMWQAWKCGGSTSNANLRGPTNTTAGDDGICVSVDHTFGQSGLQIRGANALEQELRDAKTRGNLFARKFQSDDTYWLEWIQQNLHIHTNTTQRHM